jgi:hypothetical protein
VRWNQEEAWQAGAAAVDRRRNVAASGDGGAAWHAREKTAGKR